MVKYSDLCKRVQGYLEVRVGVSHRGRAGSQWGLCSWGRWHASGGGSLRWNWYDGAKAPFTKKNHTEQEKEQLWEGEDGTYDPCSAG